MTIHPILERVRKTRAVVSGVFLLIAVLSCFNSTTLGQAVSTAAADSQSQPADVIQDKTMAESQKPIVETNPGNEGVSSVPRRFQYGLRLTIRGVYDDNINLSDINRVSDYYFVIEPAIALGFGDIVNRQENYIRLDYAPSIFLFTDHSEADAVQHVIRLEGHHRFGRLNLILSQDVQLLHGANLDVTPISRSVGGNANVDVSGRTRLNAFATHLSASYDLTGKTFLSGGVDYSIWDYSSLISSQSISGNIFINYNYSPKLVIGVGGTGGYNWVDPPNPDQTFEQANVRMTYEATGKIRLNGSAGVEFRQFGNSSRGEYTSPVFELGATYQPFDGTTIAVAGNRRNLNSAALAGEDYTATNIVIGVQQRFLRRIYLGLTGGYENTNYFSTVNGMSATRHDNYYFVKPAIDVRIARFWTVGAYYLRRQNGSSSDGFGFDDNQIGFRNALTF